MKFCCVMKRKRYSQFRMKGEEPFTSEPPPAQPPGSPTTSPPHPPLLLSFHTASPARELSKLCCIPWKLVFNLLVTGAGRCGEGWREEL